MERNSAVVDRQAKFWRLKQAPLFGDLTDAELKELSGLCDIRLVERHTPVYEAGDPSDRVFILESGSVNVARVGEQGREVNVAVLGSGEIFGELALAGETIRQDSARAIEDAMVCCFAPDSFELFLVSHPTLALRVTKMIGERLQRVESRLQDILFKDVRTRLAHTMARLAEKFGDDVAEGRRIGLRLTQTDLAHFIGSTRETTSTIFNEFKRDGLVGNDGHYIIVLELEMLASYST